MARRQAPGSSSTSTGSSTTPSTCSADRPPARPTGPADHPRCCPSRAGLLFGAYTQTSGVEPWITDGTVGNTHQLADPGPNFSTSSYLAANPQVAGELVDPLAQLLGAQQGVNVPNPPSVAPHAITGGFDATYYLARNPDVATAGIDPRQHYSTYGWTEGRDPDAYFSTKGYLAANPDVAAAHIDPLQHFLQYGMAEGRHGWGV